MCWSHLDLLNKEARTWLPIFNFLHRLVTLINSIGSGKDDVEILSKTKSFKRKNIRDEESCHIIKIQFTRYENCKLIYTNNIL